MALDSRSLHLRRLALRCMKGGNRGHVGSTMSLIEIMRVLYDDVAHYRPDEPRWEGRDRVILSKGHGCIAQYVMLADKGFFPLEELDRFCKKDALLGGHPGPHVPGVECHTGALGHGLSIGVGMALAAKMQGRDTRVFVVMGDGEINEGSVWEAAMCASKHGLSNLTVIIDYNKIQSAGFVEDIQPLEPLGAKWEAFGWWAAQCDGHDVVALHDKLKENQPARPQALIAHTVKGKGLPFAENDPMWHYKSPLTPEMIGQMEQAL